MNRGKAGISPVMATVILVAIAIVIAIAVAFWATGLVGVFTRFEKLEITAAYYEAGTGVILRVRNTGSSSATIDDVYVNGRPLGRSGINTDTTNIDNPCTTGGGNATYICTCSPGQEIIIQVGGPEGAGTDWAPGVTYEVAVHTASGKTYPAAVQIP